MATKKTSRTKSSAKKPVRVPTKAPARKTPKVMARRADHGAPVDGWFDGIPSNIADLLATLRQIVLAAAPGAAEAIKWGMPVYTGRRMICYLRDRPTYATLGFYEAGTSLDDPKGLLEGTGANMRHVKVRAAADIDAKLFTKWVRAAVAWDARRG